MGSRVEWYVREYRCANGVCEKMKFPVLMDGAIREGTRRHARTVNRAEKLAAEAARELALLLNNNFRAGRDRYLTLDYSDSGMDGLVLRAGTDDADALYRSAEREAVNYIKRLRRACRAAGVELRIVYVTSDMDGMSFAPVRVHHHLVVNDEAAALAERCWTAGGAKARVLYGAAHGDLTELAAYMIGQVRTGAGQHRYHPSRNLARPEPTKRRPIRNPDAVLQVPKGCALIWRSEGYAGRPQTLRYYRPPELRAAGRRKETGHGEDETG